MTVGVKTGMRWVRGAVPGGHGVAVPISAHTRASNVGARKVGTNRRTSAEQNDEGPAEARPSVLCAARDSNPEPAS